MRAPAPWRALRGPAAATLALLALAGCGGEPYDLALEGGRLVDPASGTDGVRTLGIRDGTVERVSQGPLEARDTLDAEGLVVAPGFIDLLAEYPEEDEGAELKAFDGVTTMVAMAGVPEDLESWYREREERGALLHFGAAAGLASLRQEAGATEPHRPASPEQVEAMAERAQELVEAGAPGLGLEILQHPGASRAEILRLFQVAAEKGVPVHTRIRHFGDVDPATSGVAALQEVVAASAATGARTQVLHMNSMLAPVEQMTNGLELLEGARARDVPVSASVYPYTAAASGVHTASFDPGWQERYGGLAYQDLRLVSTGESLDEERFYRYRQRDTVEVIMDYMPEESVEAALVHPSVSVASDGVIEGGRGHPRGAGTFARVLGRYVREKGLLSLPEAVEKMALLPAEALADAVPAMKRKGRIEPGADADVVVFDPQRVRDGATFDEPALSSRGMVHVLVGGEAVIRAGALRADASPGRPIRR